nr:ribonuclease H-like domain-containing protein [Tanacetum cinerariifolium]
MHDPREPHFSALKRILCAKAKYRGVNAVAETCWLRNLLRELHTPLSSPTLVYCDNISVVYFSSNLVQHQRTKHIEIDIYFVRDLVATGQFSSFGATPSSRLITDHALYSLLLTTLLAAVVHHSIAVTKAQNGAGFAWESDVGRVGMVREAGNGEIRGFSRVAGNTVLCTVFQTVKDREGCTILKFFIFGPWGW